MVLDDAIALADERNESYLESDYYRLKGICLLNASPDRQLEAEACFNKALSISRRQGALSLELRAAIGMAGLWRENGRVQESIRLLDDVCSRVEEGLQSIDYREARALRGGLAPARSPECC